MQAPSYSRDPVVTTAGHAAGCVLPVLRKPGHPSLSKAPTGSNEEAAAELGSWAQLVLRPRENHPQPLPAGSAPGVTSLASRPRSPTPTCAHSSKECCLAHNLSPEWVLLLRLN